MEKLLIELFNRIATLEEKVEALEKDLLRKEEYNNSFQDEIITEIKGKYRAFTEYLTNSSSDILELTFSEIEDILQESLPPSARQHRSVWSNAESSSLALAWLNAGYRTSEVDMENEKVKFEKAKFTMKGFETQFFIRMGASPQSENAIRELKVYRGESYPLVYDKQNLCVGVVFKHNENRSSAANGQCEICFFDDFYKEYGKWHRLFSVSHKGKERILYDDFKKILDEQGEYRYFAAIKAR